MDKSAVKLAPSILAADFAHLGKGVGEAEQAGVHRLHVDIQVSAGQYGDDARHIEGRDGRAPPSVAVTSSVGAWSGWLCKPQRYCNVGETTSYAISHPQL